MTITPMTIPMRFHQFRPEQTARRTCKALLSQEQPILHNQGKIHLLGKSKVLNNFVNCHKEAFKNLLVLNERTKYFSLSQGRPRSKRVNFNEWIKLKKTIALLVLFSLVLAALISISVLYFLAECSEWLEPLNL